MALFVQNPKRKGQSVLILGEDGSRHVCFDARGISEALSPFEYQRLLTMRAYTAYAVPDDDNCLVGDLGDTEVLPPEGEAPEQDGQTITLAELAARMGMDLVNPSGAVDLDTIEAPPPTLVEQFRKGDQEARTRFIEDGNHTHAELVELFNVEANWRRSKKVLDALDTALAKAKKGRSVETINRALLLNSAPIHKEE